MSDTIKIDKAIITQHKAEGADLRKVMYLSNNPYTLSNPVYYQICLVMNTELIFGPIDENGFSNPLAEVYKLYIGNETIDRFTGDDKGIIFKCYTKQELENLYGQRVRFSLDGINFIDSGFNFPSTMELVDNQ